MEKERLIMKKALADISTYETAAPTAQRMPEVKVTKKSTSDAKEIENE